jgi:hypothetical protein
MIAALLLYGCIKFDDPPVGDGGIPPIFSSPCADTLIDNEVFFSTTSGFALDGFTIDSTACAEDGVDYSSSDGSFEIRLFEPITENSTYELSFFGVGEGQAQIRFRNPGFIGSSNMVSSTGTLYASALATGSFMLEWCKVRCQTQSSGSLILVTSGRVVCE